MPDQNQPQQQQQNPAAAARQELATQQQQTPGFGQRRPESVAGGLNVVVGPPEDPEDFGKRKRGWMAFMEKLVQSPHAQDFLLTAGSRLLQPIPVGGTPAGQLGTAVREGNQAYQQSRQQAAEGERAERKLDLAERRTVAQERQQETMQGQLIGEERRAQKELGLREREQERKERATLSRERLEAAKARLADARARALQIGGDADAPADLQMARALADAWLSFGKYANEDVALSKALEFVKTTGRKDKGTFLANLYEESADMLSIMDDDERAEVTNVFRDITDQLYDEQNEPAMKAEIRSRFAQNPVAHQRGWKLGGWIPATKQFQVLDEQGNPVGAYPKRQQQGEGAQQ